MHFYFKKALLFCSQFCESEIWEDSVGQSLLGVSPVAAVTCQLGSRYRGAVLGWTSTMAHSHGWQSMLSVGDMLGLSTPGPTCGLSSTMISQDHLVGQLAGCKMVLQPFLKNRICQSHLLKAAELWGMSLGPLTVKTFKFQNSSLGSMSGNRWGLLGKLNRQIYF